MTLPDGFTAELVAAEPNLVNPIGIAFDEFGRIWVTESLEYPRSSPGVGRDRIRVLEDTDGDGVCDKFTTFAEGLNIPSGIAVGHGGVWVANAPDLLFLQDTDGDLKADKTEVVVTGFGRTDTHELPNSLTWGPDGYLYGLNGVFNYSDVRYHPDNPNYKKDGPNWKFTCAVFRISPYTREFEIFAEGTSNPWGIAFDNNGSMFLSACVIDHLWHIVESGYYHRQGGPYPPHTWKLESIVDHKHQLAAYCGIQYLDSDAYPPEYRGHLYMGNIHGGCINVDTLQRRGSSYQGKPREDFLTGHDAWFMPVAQKVGPDGCLYVLDWYDRYHCYQDARRDPEGIDRLKGRLYRIRHKTSPPGMLNVGDKFVTAMDDELIAMLGAGNQFTRETARRMLIERGRKLLASGGDDKDKQLVGKVKFTLGLFELTKLALDDKTPDRQRNEALFALVSSHRVPQEMLVKLLQDSRPLLRKFGVKAAGSQRTKSKVVIAELQRLIESETHPDVLLQLVIAVPKLDGIDTVPALATLLQRCGDDHVIPHIVWQNLEPHLDTEAAVFMKAVSTPDALTKPGVQKLLPHAVDRLLAERDPDLAAMATLFRVLTAGKTGNAAAAKRCLQVLGERVQNRELNAEQFAQLKQDLLPALANVRQQPQHPLHHEAILVAALYRDETAISQVRQWVTDENAPAARRLRSLATLGSLEDEALTTAVMQLIALGSKTPAQVQAAGLQALSRLRGVAVADAVLKTYADLSPELQPKAIELLTQRPLWGKSLLNAIAAETVPANALNANQARRLSAMGDAGLAKLLREHWGAVRDSRDPAREELLNRMRQELRYATGDAHAGAKVFKKVCGQCHQMYGEGEKVGPDITRNGRSSFEQLLSNVFDPSLVIGKDYQAVLVATTDGRQLTGLLVEDNDSRVVLKVQGGKLETIARDDVAAQKLSKVSLMPEGLEKQLKPQELRDLFAYITLDKPPTDKDAAYIPGAGPLRPRASTDAAKFDEMVDDVLPGFRTQASGEGGVAVLAEHRGRAGVLRTHPVDRNKSCVLTKSVTLPANPSRLRLEVAAHAEGDWRLQVLIDGRKRHEQIVAAKSPHNGWHTIDVDLSGYAGKAVTIELRNVANDWRYEFGYWGRADIEPLPKE